MMMMMTTMMKGQDQLEDELLTATLGPHLDALRARQREILMAAGAVVLTGILLYLAPK